MNLKRIHLAICYCIVLSLTTFSFAEESAKSKKVEGEKKAVAAKKTEKPKPEAKPKLATKATGHFEAIHKSEISADTEQFKSLVIKKVLPYGTKVAKGQNLVWFETEELDKKIKEAETAYRLAELAFQEAELNYDQFVETQKLDRAKTERTYRLAKTKYGNYIKTDLERQLATANYNLKSYQASLENATEEYIQLEKMYKEDELTEESEEIVLKRAKRAVESAKFRLQGAEVQAKRSIEQTIPNGKADQEDTLARARLSYDKAIRTSQWARQRKDIEFKKEKEKIQKQKEDLAKLRADRTKMVIQSPQEGYLYYGKLTKGKVSDKPALIAAKATVTNKQVIATVAQASSLKVQAEVLEKDLRHVTKGGKAIVSATAYPDRKLDATVLSIATVPKTGNKYECVLSVKLGKQQPAILPGMTCNIEFISK